MADDISGLSSDAGGGGGGKGGTSPIVIILLLLNSVIMGGVGFLQYKLHLQVTKDAQIKDVVKSQMDEKKAEEEHNKEKEKHKGEKAALAPPEDNSQGFLFPLEGFTANLSQSDGLRRYVRITLVLKFSPDSKEEEFKSRQPQIRDVIIGLLNSKRAEDLIKSEGKSYLKEEIKTSVNAFLVDGKLEDVYYIGFVIN